MKPRRFVVHGPKTAPPRSVAPPNRAASPKRCTKRPQPGTKRLQGPVGGTHARKLQEQCAAPGRRCQRVVQRRARLLPGGGHQRNVPDGRPALASQSVPHGVAKIARPRRGAGGRLLRAGDLQVCVHYVAGDLRARRAAGQNAVKRRAKGVVKRVLKRLWSTVKGRGARLRVARHQRRERFDLSSGRDPRGQRAGDGQFGALSAEEQKKTRQDKTRQDKTTAFWFGLTQGSFGCLGQSRESSKTDRNAAQPRARGRAGGGRARASMRQVERSQSRSVQLRRLCAGVLGGAPGAAPRRCPCGEVVMALADEQLACHHHFSHSIHEWRWSEHGSKWVGGWVGGGRVGEGEREIEVHSLTGIRHELSSSECSSSEERGWGRRHVCTVG